MSLASIWKLSKFILHWYVHLILAPIFDADPSLEVLINESAFCRPFSFEIQTIIQNVDALWEYKLLCARWTSTIVLEVFFIPTTITAMIKVCVLLL